LCTLYVSSPYVMTKSECFPVSNKLHWKSAFSIPTKTASMLARSIEDDSGFEVAGSRVDTLATGACTLQTPQVISDRECQHAARPVLTTAYLFIDLRNSSYLRIWAIVALELNTHEVCNSSAVTSKQERCASVTRGGGFGSRCTSAVRGFGDRTMEWLCSVLKSGTEVK